MCVLRVSGDSFDPDELLRGLRLKASHRFKAGEPRWKAKPDGRKNTYSGFTVNVSDAQWTLRDQVDDATRFIVLFEQELRALAGTPGVDDIRLDFPIEQRDVFAQAEYFPPTLVQAAGRVPLGLEITLYPCSDDDDDVQDYLGESGGAA